MANKYEPDVLAALGAYQFRSGLLLESEQPDVLIVDPRIDALGAARSAPVRCRVDPEQLEKLNLSPSVQDSLREIWGRVNERHAGDREGLRLGLDPYDAGQFHELRLWLAAATGVQSVFIADRSLAAGGSWHWPLRIGFLPDADSRDLRSITTQQYGHPQLLEPMEIGTDAASCDLLIVRNLRSLKLAGPSVRAGSVLALEASDDRLPLPGLRAAARQLEASAISYVSDPARLSDPGEFFGRLFDAIARDHSLDVALAAAVGDAHSYELVAHPGFLESTRVTATLDRVREQVENAVRNARAGSAGRIGGPEIRRPGPQTETVRGAHPGVARPPELKELTRALEVMNILDGQLHEVGWGSAGDGAAAGATAVEKVRPVIDGASGRLEPRWLQAQVYEALDGAWRRRIGSFRAATEHQIRIRIGPGQIDWVQVDRAFDETRLPDDAPFHSLEVLLACKDAQEKAQLQSIALPSQGPSTEARFALTLPAGVAEIEASVIVLFENRHLQSAVLRGRVIADHDGINGDAIAFRPGEAEAIDFQHPGHSDLFFYYDHQQVLVRPRGEAAWEVPLAGVEQLVDRIRQRMYEAARGAAQLETGIEQGPGLELLRMLAAQGRFLRNQLLGDRVDMAALRHVEVVSPYSAQNLPVELFYDGDAPAEDAAICSAFLHRGAEDNDAGEPICEGCRAKAEPGRWICPGDFWALNRIVERQVRTLKPPPGAAPASSPEPSFNQSTLKPLRRVVVAASDQVTTLDQKATLQWARTIDPDAHESTTWDDWKSWVEMHEPELLVALPHNVPTAFEFQALEIGRVDEGDRLRLDEIAKRWPAATGQPGPIVLLLGCNTAASDMEYQDFVTEIRRRGATVVVGTLTTVLGRYAAPVAQEFVRLLAPRQRSQPLAFGEVLRRVRIRMLRDGNLMALALVAYGNSGWQVPP